MKKRVISAVVMIIITVPFIIIGGLPFKILLNIISILGLMEIVKLELHHNKIPYLIEFLSIISLILLNIGLTKYIGIIFLSLFIPCMFYKKKKYSTYDAIYLLGTIIFLSLSFNTLIKVRDNNIYLFLYLVSIPILNDIFAMLIGSKFGKHKITSISPNKSIEGYLSGTLISVLIGSLIYIFLISKESILITILITLYLSILGQLGDLFFSKIKRENKIKDFSNLIPGHGGILDRLDSVIFTSIAYIVLL